MKTVGLLVFIFMLSFQLSYSQPWLTSLDAAKRLALVQDKMILMVWEQSTIYPLPVKIRNSKGPSIRFDNLFESEQLNPIIWDHFVPVIVSDYNYETLFTAIEGKRTLGYIDKFNDDSVKIMDANGNILNTEIFYGAQFDLTNFFLKYYIKTTFLKIELTNYVQEQNFTTSFRLADKYIEAAIYLNEDVRNEIIALSTIYLLEAKAHLLTEDLNHRVALKQKLELTELYQNLVLNKPRKVLRQLNRIRRDEVHPINQTTVAFLYLTSYRILKDEESASVWRSKLSLRDLKKSNKIISQYLQFSNKH